MTRLAISVEGATEREFVSRVLAPHLHRCGWADVKPVDLGGNVSVDKIARALPPLLGSFAHVTTLYDFYGFKRRGGRSVDALEAAILESVSPDRQRRLTPYVQLHEFEALLFAAPAQANDWMGGKPAHLAALQSALDECGQPEAINDRLETSPSHRLQAQFPHYDKKLHGPDIAELIGLSAIRQACLRFDGWVTRLEELAAAAAR